MSINKPNHDSLLLVLPITFIGSNDKLFIDQQTYNGIRLWLDNFQSVTIACFSQNVDLSDKNLVPIDTLVSFDRLILISMPNACKPFTFIRHLPSVVSTLRQAISRSHHLCFMLWGLWGDWGSVASLVASRSDRHYVIWTDTVASRVLEIQAADKSGMQKIYVQTIARLTGHYEKYVIGKSVAGLFHGMDTYKYYSPFSRNPQLVHNIHLGPEFRISPEDLLKKLARPANNPLQIVYAGRVHPDKGLLDWLETLAKLKVDNVEFKATWFGDGPQLKAARDFVKTHNLDEWVSFPGPMSDRKLLLEAIRTADIFMFCHKTPESPRCLIEALLSGTPIVGYGSHYSEDLIAVHGGGVLVSQSTTLLTDAVRRLSRDRRRLADLQERAAKDGFPMTDEHVFQHRSQLLRDALPHPAFVHQYNDAALAASRSKLANASPVLKRDGF